MIPQQRTNDCDSPVRRYLRQIADFPILSREEECALGRRWRHCGDTEAAHRLTTSHLRLAARIALRYRCSGVPAADLIGEGNVGLVRAVHGFDPERGFRLASYAIRPIKAAVQEHVMHTWSLVKIGTTPAQRKLFFRIRCMQGAEEPQGDGELRHDQVSAMVDSLAVPAREVINMTLRVGRRDHLLTDDLASTSDGTDSPEAICAVREEDARRRLLLVRALKLLTPRECRIVFERRLASSPATLESLARFYGVSPERIRQIEAGALEKIRECVRALP